MLEEEIEDQPSATQVAASYDARASDFEDDSATLGQKNLDQDLRTTITQAEALGLGFVGTVCRVAYGTWQQRHALILLMKFDFRAKTGKLRFKRAEITIRFEPYNSKTVAPPPQVRQFYPKTHDSIPKSSRTIRDDITQREPVGFTLRGKTWGTQSVIWTITESDGKHVGIPEQIYLAVVVETGGSLCKAFVEAVAKTAVRLQLFVNPWARDDPLLFNGSTTKGLPPPKTLFDELTDSDWTHFIHESPNNQAAMSSRVYRVRGVPIHVDASLLVTTLLKHGGYGVEEKHIIAVLSFAHNPYRSEIVAVVSLPSTYVRSGGQNSDEWRITCRFPHQPSLSIRATETQNDVELTLDTHFRGFTALGKAPLEMRPESEYVDTKLFLVYNY
jgi:hypothetical protein